MRGCGRVDIIQWHLQTVLSTEVLLCLCLCVIVGMAVKSGGSLVPEESVGGNAFCYSLLPGHLASHRRD